MTTIFEVCEEEALASLTYDLGATVKKSQKVIIDDWNGFSLTGKEIAELENFPEGEEEQEEHKRASKRIAYRIAKEFKAWSGKNDKIKHKYQAVVLSFAEDDREKLEADPQLRQQIIQDWLQDMGYDDAQFLAVYHDEANKPHIHILLNLVDSNHKAYDRYRDRYRSQKACRDIEKKYELKVGLGEDESYAVDLEKTGEKNQERVRIGNLAKEAAKTATSFEEFKEQLKTKGVSVDVITNNNGTRGLVFRLGDDGIPFAGGKVHSSLTYGKVQGQLNKNTETKVRAEYMALMPALKQSSAILNGLYSDQRILKYNLRKTNAEISKLYSQIKAISEERKRVVHTRNTALKQALRYIPEDDIVLTLAVIFVALTVKLIKATINAVDEHISWNAALREIDKLDEQIDSLSLTRDYEYKNLKYTERDIASIKVERDEIKRELDSIRATIDKKQQTAPKVVEQPSREVVKEFSRNYYNYRIMKVDGIFKLQRLEPDTSSPVVDHRYSRNAWFTKEQFVSFKVIGQDADSVYLKITDLKGKTRFINENGYDLSNKVLQQLGLIKSLQKNNGPLL